MKPTALRNNLFRSTRFFCLLAILLSVSFFLHAQTNTWTGAVNANWGTGGNWSQGIAPTSLHNVFIPNNVSISINVPAVCANLTINGGANATTVTIAGSNTLQVGGTITLAAGTASGANKTLAIGSGSVTAAAISMAVTTNDNRTSSVTLSTGTLTVTGNIVMSDTDPDRNLINITSTGRINLGGAISGGDLLSNNGSFFNYNGTIAQTVTISGYQYGNLYINNTSVAGATLSAAISGTIVATDINVQSGKLNNGGFAINLSNNDDFILGVSAAFVLTGTTSMPGTGGNGTIILDPTSSVSYAGANQNVDPLDYGNLLISGTGTKFSDADFTVNGDLSISSNFEINNGGGSSTLTLIGDFTHTAGDLFESGPGTGIIQFAGIAEQIFTSGGTVTGTINYIVNNGAFLQTAADGTLINGNSFVILSGGLLGIRSANGITTAPTASGNIRTTTRTYTAGASYIYNGTTNQVTGSGLTANTPLDLFIENPGNTVTLSAATTISRNLTLRLGTLSAGTLTLTVGGNWINNATGFSAGTGNVILNGSGVQTISGSTATSFNNLNLNKTAGSVSLAQNIIVNAALNIGVNLNIANQILTMGCLS